MQPLSARITNFPVTETNVTKSTKTVIEMRCIETNEHFRFLEECMEWVTRQLVRRQKKRAKKRLSSSYLDGLGLLLLFSRLRCPPVLSNVFFHSLLPTFLSLMQLNHFSNKNNYVSLCAAFGIGMAHGIKMNQTISGHTTVMNEEGVYCNQKVLVENRSDIFSLAWFSFLLSSSLVPELVS